MMAACTLLAACHQDETTNRPPETLSDHAIRFEIGFAPTTRTETGADFKTTWTSGDRIGLFAAPAGEPLQSTGNPIHNVALTFDGTQWSGEAFWPEECETLDFYAYYPYDEAAEIARLDRQYTSVVNSRLMQVLRDKADIENTLIRFF